MHTALSENLKETSDFEGLAVEGRIILKRILDGIRVSNSSCSGQSPVAYPLNTATPRVP
jgi:hypothetical protein